MAVQAGCAAALESWADFVPRNVAVFQERRDAAVASFREAGFQCDTPKGAMYLWLALPDGVGSHDFANRLLEEEGVIVLPGAAFGAAGEGYFRLSFIVPPARMREAAQRAGRVLASMLATV
jgi:LL-diaminopimelate aminotransferase